MTTLKILELGLNNTSKSSLYTAAVKGCAYAKMCYISINSMIITEKYFKQLLSIGVWVLLLVSTTINAQEVETTTILSKEEAVQLMLKNNFDIKVANNNTLVAGNNSDILNSGYLPSVFGLAGADFDRTTSETDFNGATTDEVDPITLDTTTVVRDNVVIPDAETVSYNASVNAEYTLFDGLGRLYTYKQLKEQYNLTQLQARETIETTMLQLFSVYYEVARLEENLKTFEDALDISQNRELRATYQFEYGQVNKLEILNAQVDVVTDSINLMNARQELRNTQRDLNVVLASDIKNLQTADTAVAFVSPLLMDSYMEQAQENNVSLLQIDKNILISDYDIKVAKSLFLPTIGLTGSYGWDLSNNPATAFFPGTTRTSRGFAAGASLRWEIFDGGTSITGFKNAKILKENQELLKQQLEKEVLRDIANAKGDYRNALAIYNLQEQNVKTNLANFKRSEERLKLGQITSIEFRQAQLNLLNAKTTKNAAKYTAKLAEITLLQLTGQLLNVDF